jgi:hypothetical protein
MATGTWVMGDDHRGGLPAVLGGTVLGLAAGLLIAALGGERGDQLELVLVTGIGIGTYLSVMSCAFATERPIAQALIAPFATGAAIIIISGAALVGFFAVFFAVPAALVLGAIYFVPWLSFMEEWPGEVQGLIVQPFVYIWFILVLEKRLARPEGLAPTSSTRLGRLAAVLSRLGRSSVSRPGAARVLGWLTVQINPWAIATVAVVALVLPLPVVLIDYYAFQPDYSAVRPASVLNCAVGAVAGAVYGLFIGVAAGAAGASCKDD